MFSFSYFSGMIRSLHTYDMILNNLPTEFTKKDFESMFRHKRNVATLDLMRNKGLIRVVRWEECGTKEIEVPAWQARYMLIDKNGNELMEEKKFLDLPESTRKALLALNGADFKVERKATKTITLTRNYYMLCADNYNRIADNTKKYKTRYIESIDKKIEEAKARLAIVNLW